MVRLPNPAALVTASRRVAQRFPESVIAAIVAYAFASLAIGANRDFFQTEWWRWVAAATLGIPAGVGVAIVFERLSGLGHAAPRLFRVLTGVLLFGLLAGFALSMPSWSAEIQTKRTLHLSLAVHLFVAFVPFLFQYQANAFWQWNRTLFVRFVIAFLFSGVLFAGLGIALAAGKPLFGINVQGEVFENLWFAIALLFNTGYFLAGVPEDFRELERDESYPGVLKVFAQYILAPLVVIYLTILSAYLVRVLATGQWPKGWIGWLVSSVSVAGMLSLLLVHPVRNRSENKWIGIYSRTFYLALLPSIAMLFTAIGKRISQYGITEDRYFLLVLAIWLAVMAVAYGFRRLSDIRWIPITLCVLAFATWWGPWGAYGVSRSNQANRLSSMLERHGVLASGKRVTPPPTLSLEVRKQMSSSIDYLARTHGVGALPAPLRRLAPVDSTLKASEYRWQRGAMVARTVMSELGLGYIEPWQSADIHYFSFYEQPQTTVVEDIAGFTRVVTFNGVPPITFETPAGKGRIEAIGRERSLRIESPEGVRWQVSLDSIVHDLELKPTPQGGRIRFDVSGAGGSARLILRQLNGQMGSDSMTVHNLGGDLYLTHP